MEHVDMRAIEAKYDQEMSPPPVGLDVPDRFHYLHFKAFVYLLLGPETYRSHDALGIPPTEWPALTLDVVQRGCEQLVRWRGPTPTEPVEGIGVGGYYALLRLLHCAATRVQTLASAQSDCLLDQMRARHDVDGDEITLYNLVEVRSAQKKGGLPAPTAAHRSARRRPSNVGRVAPTGTTRPTSPSGRHLYDFDE